MVSSGTGRTLRFKSTILAVNRNGIVSVEWEKVFETRLKTEKRLGRDRARQFHLALRSQSAGWGFY